MAAVGFLFNLLEIPLEGTGMSPSALKNPAVGLTTGGRFLMLKGIPIP